MYKILFHCWIFAEYGWCMKSSCQPLKAYFSNQFQSLNSGATQRNRSQSTWLLLATATAAAFQIVLICWLQASWSSNYIQQNYLKCKKQLFYCFLPSSHLHCCTFRHKKRWLDYFHGNIVLAAIFLLKTYPQ